MDKALCDKVRKLRTAPESVARDQRMTEMRLVRANNFEMLNPDAFSEAWPKSVASNFIAQAAMDMAESLAPLPALSCASGSMTSSSAKDKAALRQKVASYYWEKSGLKRHSVNAADWYFTYGFLPIIVEPCFETNFPKIRFEDPFMSYPDVDRYGRVNCYVKVLKMRTEQLGALYPELVSQICYDQYGQRQDIEVEVIRYMDRNMTCMYVEMGDSHARKTVELSTVGNSLGRCPVEIAARPTLDGQYRGQYDDAVWVQLARSKMMSLALEAGVKAVEAPIAVPQDLVELPIGPDAIWRTETPEKIRRVALEISPSAFQMEQRLEMEQMRATRYPEARGGNINASVITGRGVDALMGGFDMLIKSAQDQLGEALAGATSLAFEMDEKLFGDVQKEIIGISAGAPYKEKYTPKRAIGGDYSVECTYGLAAGLAPNNAVVLMLQLLGAGLISKESVQKQLPFDVNSVEMAQAIAMERARDAILEGMAGYAQSIPAQAAQGMNPAMAITQLATFLTSVRKGKDIEEAALEAFAPPEPPPGQGPEGDQMLAAEAAAQQAGPPGMGGAPAGPEGPQALPDVASMVAAFRGGRADLSASVKRNQLI